jgi:hypothetical protein
VLSAVGSRRALGLPDGNCGAQCTDTESEDEATNNKLCEVEASALQDFSDKGQDSSTEDNFSSSKDIADPSAGKSTEERANGEGSNDCSLDGRFMAFLSTMSINGVNLRKVVVPVAQGQKTSDTRLVVSEKDEGWQDDQQ